LNPKGFMRISDRYIKFKPERVNEVKGQRVSFIFFFEEPLMGISFRGLPGQWAL
jgi:hypothetical protein